MKSCPQCYTGYPDSHTTCPIHGVPLNEIRDLKPGMVIHNSYRIIRKLGQGGMGAVYLAQHILMDEPRALKFLSGELSRDQAFTSRFLREVRTLRQIRNRNVVDCGDLEAAEDGSLFFSMEFVDGPDLRAFLNSVKGTGFNVKGTGFNVKGTGFSPYIESRNRTAALAAGGGGDTEGGGGFNPRIKPTQSTRALAPEALYQGTASAVPQSSHNIAGALAPEGALPVELALSIARQIAEGLGAAHSKGMVHRDIKPENILMARDAAAWLPKIADFGIVATKESSTAYTRTGGTLLTMAYAAPEQWRGTPAASLDGRTDLYALGGLLYEMLTGQTPFHAENYEGWARQHQTTPPPPPSALRPDLANWQGLDALLLRLLAKDRNDRPKDVAELIWLIDAVRYLPPKVHRETIAERLKPQTIGLFLGKNIKRMPRWSWITLAAFLTINIASTAIILHISPSKIASRAFIMDKAHHYNLGGILRNLACMRGYAFSCTELADMYYYGRGVEQNLMRAHELYLHAAALYSPECTSGSGDACFNLARLYKGGKGVEMDPSRADLLVKQGIELDTEKCDAGDGKVCGRLGLDYSVGDDLLQKDYVKAAEFYTNACNLGEAQWGCISLGTAYKFGRGVPESSKQAVEFYIKGCNLGELSGCREAGDVYGWGAFGGAGEDYARAATFYARACDGGEDLSCDELGDLYRDGSGVPHDVAKAKFYYSKACSLSTELHFGCDDLKKIK